MSITSDDDGVYCDVDELLKLMVKHHNLKLGDDEVFDVNVLADGRSYGGARSTTLVCLRLVRRNGEVLERPTSQDALFPVAILKCQEVYEDIKRSTAGLRGALKRVQQQGLTVGDKKLQLRLWLSGDMKLLLLVLGLGAANSDQSCVYCTSTKEERMDPMAKWSISRLFDMTNGQIRENLFDFIPLERVVVDLLHMLMR